MFKIRHKESGLFIGTYTPWIIISQINKGDFNFGHSKIGKSWSKIKRVEEIFNQIKPQYRDQYEIVEYKEV